MPRASTQQLVRSQLDAAARRDERFLDLQIEFVRYKSGTPIVQYGGRWDRTAKDFVGRASRSMIFELHGAQVEAILLFDQWLDEHYRGPDPELLARVRDIIEQNLAFDTELGGLLGMSELFLTGGRRSGKTFLMEAILCSYAVAVPDSIVWTVVPSEKFIEEPRKVIADSILPSAWYEYNGSPQFTFYLVNGSQHVLLSGHKPSNLKKGKATLVGLNEAQQIRAESYRNARGATVDAGGFSICAANPPIAGDIGTWVLDAATAIETNDRPAAEHVFVDPLLNPHVDPRKLLALKSSMTLHDWETQIRGKMLQLPDRVLYTWDRAVNERAAPDFGRITREFLTAWEGDRARWDKLIAVDVQRFPWVAVGIFDVYRDPRTPGDAKTGLLWMVDEVALSAGDEVDVCRELVAKGYDGERCLVVTDASCEWQQLERDLIRQRPNYKGKGTNYIPPRERLPARRAAGPQLEGQPRHPGADPGDERVHPPGRRRAEPVHRRQEVPDRGRQRPQVADAQGPAVAHREGGFGDILGYAVWRFFPRRGDAKKLLESEALPRAHTEGFRELAGGDPVGGFAAGGGPHTV